MQRMLPLKAIRPHLYGTRRLEAGDEYEAPAERAIALVAERKADFAKAKKPAAVAPVQPAPTPTPEPKSKPEPEPELEPVTTEAAIDRLRLEATQLGINVDGRWGVARLRYEIAQAQR
jgi:hypothetical protein